MELRLQDGQLQVVSPATGERLLTPAESHAARRTEAEARRAAEACAALAESELEQMRVKLAHPRGERRPS